MDARDRGGQPAKLLTRDEARRIAANIARLPELLRETWQAWFLKSAKADIAEMGQMSAFDPKRTFVIH